jgi:hypothetical protein
MDDMQIRVDGKILGDVPGDDGPTMETAWARAVGGDT